MNERLVMKGYQTRVSQTRLYYVIKHIYHQRGQLVGTLVAVSIQYTNAS